MLEKHDDKLLISLKKCGRCSSLIEVFETPVMGDSHDSLLYQIMQDKKKEMKVHFQGFKISCPRCKDTEKDVTYVEAGEDDLALLNDTALAKVYITVSPV